MNNGKKLILDTESGEAYYCFLDSMPTLIFIQNSDNDIVFFNKAWVDFTGRPFKKASRKQLQNSVHPEDNVCLENELNQSDQDLSGYFEFRLKNNQDQYRWVCNYRTPLFDSDQQFIGYLNQCYDIHDTKLNRDAIATREERYNFAVNATGIGLWDLLLTEEKLDTGSGDTNKLIWNDNMFQLFNVDPNAFLGLYQDFENCVHPDDRDKVKQHIAQCFETKNLLKIQFRLISHPGEIRYISAQAVASFDEKNKPIRLTGINQDITSLEKEKMKVQSLYHQVQENEKKYRALFESSSDAIMLLGDNHFIECNDATLSMFACPDKKSFLNSHPSDFSPPKQPDGRPSKLAADEYIASALREGKANFSWMHQRLNGDIFPAEVLLTPVDLNGPKIVQATVRDITKLTQLQEKLTFLSVHDRLTGLYNRNGFTRIFSEILAHSKRYTHSFSMLMLDIDFFKRINDVHGHQVGDKVLVHLANTVSHIIRTSDTAVRFGGEEFIILLPETDTIKAKKLAERIRLDLEKSTLPISDKKEIKYTVSIGIATYPKNGKNKTHLLTAADKALYLAKEAGRNKVVVIEE
ncbi:MAG: diguanylate cyclase [Gammaproteobacteria bacterium]|nr:diguanylate cyclase [Gammaproteobacteria bacterium]